MPAWRSKASATLSRSGSASASACRPRWLKQSGSGRGRRQRQKLGAILHQRRIGLERPIPLEQGELGVVQRGPLAVAEDMGEGEDARLAGRQQLLAGELGRGVQP